MFCTVFDIFKLNRYKSHQLDLDPVHAISSHIVNELNPKHLTLSAPHQQRSLQCRSSSCLLGVREACRNEMPRPCGPGRQTNPMKRKQTRCPKHLRMLDISDISIFIDWTNAFIEHNISQKAPLPRKQSPLRTTPSCTMPAGRPLLQRPCIAKSHLHCQKHQQGLHAKQKADKSRGYLAESLEAPESRQG